MIQSASLRPNAASDQVNLRKNNPGNSRMRVLDLMAAGGRWGILRGNKKKRSGGKGDRLTVDKNARVVNVQIK